MEHPSGSLLCDIAARSVGEAIVREYPAGRLFKASLTQVESWPLHRGNWAQDYLGTSAHGIL